MCYNKFKKALPSKPSKDPEDLLWIIRDGSSKKRKVPWFICRLHRILKMQEVWKSQR